VTELDKSKERLETYEIYFDRQADVAFHARPVGTMIILSE